MQTKYLACGIVLIVIGIGLFMFAATQIPDYESFIGVFGRALSPELQQEYETLKAYQALGLIAGVGGLLLSIVGIVSSPKE